jgi:hypothetical protein
VGYEYSDEEFDPTLLAESAVTVHEWQSVQGDDSLNFLVIQIGHYLYFHNLGNDSVSSSYLGKIDLTPIRIGDAVDHTAPISAAAGKGKLFIVSRGISPAYISYDKDTQSFTGVKLTLKVRDIDGIPEDDESPPVFGDDVTPPAALDPADNVYDVPFPLEIPDFSNWFPRI